jgi:NADH-quinone oxidoreductase subunit L
MALFITGVGTLIHLYSIGYMHGDPNFSKFFVYLNLFVFSMLVLVLGDNLLLTFLGWEGVGACSYFLISFWFTDDANASAGKKAFVTNRIGDWGFMVAMFLAFAALGSLSYVEILLANAGRSPRHRHRHRRCCCSSAPSASRPRSRCSCGCPTPWPAPRPVSALIHAATMVTAGVYLLTRVNPIIAEAYDWAPD